MAGPTIARNYGDVAKLVEANKNSILEVNADGSIRAQTLKEKIGNLGLRITGRFTATKAEKDVKVAQAIRNLYHRAGNADGGYFDPKNNKDFARFFNPTSLKTRKAEKEVKSKTAGVFVQQNNEKQSDPLKVVAQKLLFSSLSDVFYRLSTDNDFQADSAALANLSGVCKQASLPARTEAETDASLKTLHEDLKQFGLQLGKKPLEVFDISKGAVEWAQKNAPRDLERNTNPNY
jgi:hypothetical protein